MPCFVSSAGWWPTAAIAMIAIDVIAVRLWLTLSSWIAPSLSWSETRKSIARPMAASTLSPAGFSWPAGGASSDAAVRGRARRAAKRTAPRMVFIGLLLLPRLFRDDLEIGLDHMAVLAADRLALGLHQVAREARRELAPVAGLEERVGQGGFALRAGLDRGALALAGRVGHRVLAGHLALARGAALAHRGRLRLRGGGHRLGGVALALLGLTLTLALFRLALALTLLGFALAVERIQRLGEELRGRVGERTALRAGSRAFGLLTLLAAGIRQRLGLGFDRGLRGLVGLRGLRRVPLLRGLRGLRDLVLVGVLDALGDLAQLLRLHGFAERLLVARGLLDVRLRALELLGDLGLLGLSLLRIGLRGLLELLRQRLRLLRQVLGVAGFLAGILRGLLGRGLRLLGLLGLAGLRLRLLRRRLGFSLLGTRLLRGLLGLLLGRLRLLLGLLGLLLRARVLRGLLGLALRLLGGLLRLRGLLLRLVGLGLRLLRLGHLGLRFLLCRLGLRVLLVGVGLRLRRLRLRFLLRVPQVLRRLVEVLGRFVQVLRGLLRIVEVLGDVRGALVEVLLRLLGLLLRLRGVGLRGLLADLGDVFARHAPGLLGERLGLVGEALLLVRLRRLLLRGLLLLLRRLVECLLGAIQRVLREAVQLALHRLVFLQLVLEGGLERLGRLLGQFGQALHLRVLLVELLLEAEGLLRLPELGARLLGLGVRQVLVVLRQRVQRVLQLALLLRGLVEGVLLGLGLGRRRRLVQQVLRLGRRLPKHRDRVVRVARPLAALLGEEGLRVRVAAQFRHDFLDLLVDGLLVLQELGRLGLRLRGLRLRRLVGL